jgi:hypothetical protein
MPYQSDTVPVARSTRRQLVRRLGSVAATAALIGVAAVGNPAAPPPVQAASWCSCVDYVRSAYHLSIPVPGDGGAQNMAGPYLQSQGFHQTSGPTRWGIVVFSSRYAGMNSQYGHVGLAAAWNPVSSGWRLTVRGANQPANSSNWWAEQGCTNVTDWTLANIVPYGSPNVSYWSR